jgi:glycosyltransferase involved in cell wall biosynthesis
MSENAPREILPMTESIVFLIPAYQPTTGFSDLLRRIRLEDSSHFVVVDDGSGPEYEAVFRDIAQLPGTSVLKNAVNLGKGAALKHGMNHILVNFPDCVGVVTADADGQHSPADVVRIAGVLKENPDGVVFGTRDFGAAVPLRSKLGNLISRYVYQLFIGLKLSDTQTGLRGIPRSLAERCLSIRANRYEFETEQLLIIKSTRTPLRQIPIETIYIDDNRASHFRPLLDSVQIYFVLLRYVASSLVTEGADLIVFASVMAWSNDLLMSNVVGRLVAIWVQFTLLQRFVFRLSGSARMFLAYLGLVVVSGFLSTAMQMQFANFVAAPVPAKIVAEVLVFIFNFLFLRDFVFGEWGHAARD